jgi:integrase
LVSFLQGISPGSLIFPIPRDDAVRILVRDLDAAGIPRETADGVAEFHSLRGTFVSAFMRGGASVKAVQGLARHSIPQPTLNHYAKVGLMDVAGAVESLSDPSRPSSLASVSRPPVPAAS